MPPYRRLFDPRDLRYSVFHCPGQYGVGLLMIPAPNHGFSVIAVVEMDTQYRSFVFDITAIVSIEFQFFCRTEELNDRSREVRFWIPTGDLVYGSFRAVSNPSGMIHDDRTDFID